MNFARFGRLGWQQGGGGGGGASFATLMGQRIAFFDWSKDEFFWNGASKTEGDLTVGTEARYVVSGLSPAVTDQSTIMVEYSPIPEPTAQSTLLTLDTIADGTRALQLYANEPGNEAIAYFGATFIVTENNPLAVTRGWTQRRRAIFATNAGQKPTFYQEGNTPEDNASWPSPSDVAFSRISFEGWEPFGADNFPGTLQAVHLWDRRLSRSECQTILRGDNLPIHFIGDSFLGDGQIAGHLMEPLQDVYRCLSHDGVGGTTLAQQSARWASSDWAHARDATFLIVEGGLDTSGIDVVAEIADMIARLHHDRWFWCEPCRGTHIEVGSPERTEWDAAIAAIRAAYPDNEIPTFDALAAGGDGSPEDNEDIEDGFCPRSLRIDGIHLNDAGNQIYAAQIRRKLVYYDHYDVDTSGEWDYGAGRVDGTKSVSGSNLTYTRGAGDGVNPRINIELPMRFRTNGEWYRMAATLGGTASARWLRITDNPAVWYIAQLAAAGEVFFQATEEVLYLTYMAGSGATGTTITADVISVTQVHESMVPA